MRIGMMLDTYKPHISGVTNFVSLNKEYLEQDGHEVFIFTFGDENYQDDESHVIRSPGMPLLQTGYYVGLSYNKLARQLLRTMDVVHVHHPFLSGSLALRYCRPRAIPIVFTNHTRYDLYAQAYLPGVPNVVGETALQTYLPSFCRSCDLVIAPSPGMRQVLLNFGVDVPVDVVPNGVDLQPYERMVVPLNRSEMGFEEEDVILIYTGRLGPEKNLPFLLRSFAGAYQAYDNVRLLLVGDGPERDNLKDRVKHMGLARYVTFTGMIPYDQVSRYLAMADAFVTASVTEVHPLSVIEAMASGLPVLGIQSPGVGDTVQEGVTGFIISEEDLAAYTAKMVRLVIDHEQRRLMGEQARQEVKKYDIKNTSQLMLERYQKALGLSKSRQRNFRVRMNRWLDGFRS